MNQKKTHSVEAKKQECAMSFDVDSDTHMSLDLNLPFCFSVEETTSENFNLKKT